jgi:hypothetical protein
MINERMKSFEEMTKKYEDMLDGLREVVGHLNDVGIKSIQDTGSLLQKVNSTLAPFQSDEFTDLSDSRKAQFRDLYNTLVDTTMGFQFSYSLAVQIRSMLSTYGEYVLRHQTDSVLHGYEVSIDELARFFEEAEAIIDKAMVG